MKNKLPILSQNNKEVLGYASTLKGAEKIIRKTIDIHPKMKLKVWRRSAVMIEINGGWDGYKYAKYSEW